MNISINLQRTRLSNIGLFDQGNAGAFPLSGMQRDNLSRLAAIGTRLNGLIASQNVARTGSIGGTKIKDDALSAIVADLTDLSQVSIAMEDEFPQLRAAFALPTQNRDQLWLDLAGTVPEKLAPALAQYIEAGLEPDFLADLAADIAAYNQAYDDQQDDDTGGSGDTTEIKKLVSEATKIIKKLDVFAQIRFPKDPAHPEWLPRWNTASRLGDPRRAHRKTATKTSGV